VQKEALPHCQCYTRPSALEGRFRYVKKTLITLINWLFPEHKSKLRTLNTVAFRVLATDCLAELNQHQVGE